MKTIFAPWLVSAYRWYCQEKSFSGAEYDNFCRFGRIVFLYAPFLWVFQKIFETKLGPIPLWTVVLAGSWLGLLAFHWQIALIVLGLALLVGACFRLGMDLVTKGFLYRFFAFGKGVFRVWTFLTVAGFVALAYFDWATFVYFLKILGLYALLIIVVVGLMGLFAAVANRVGKRSRTQPKVKRSRPQVLRNLGGVVSIGWHWLVLLKRKTICPWVKITPDGYLHFYWTGDPPAEAAR